MDKKKLLIIGGVVAAVVVVGVVAFFLIRGATPRTDLIQVSAVQEVVNCQLDTKMCPDGNIVVRDSTNGCDFYACPADSANPVSSTVSK